MSIAPYLREIARGSAGARSLSRSHAADLIGQVLDGTVSDIEVGAFCVAMRVKGETPEELDGFLSAVEARLNRIPSPSTAVVLPSYNGARKLPLLTPLLGLLLAQRGVPVLVHGTATEDSRVAVDEVLAGLGIRATSPHTTLEPGSLTFVRTGDLNAGLLRLLQVRRTIGLRNSAHSIVKLMNPCARAAVVVGSYTHPEYATSMAAACALGERTALLLRGTEGEPVADARRCPQMVGIVRGEVRFSFERETGSLATLPDWPSTPQADEVVAYTQAVLAGERPVPGPIAAQVARTLRLVSELDAVCAGGAGAGLEPSGGGATAG